MDYQFRGKGKTYAIRVWPQVSLVEAREKRDEAKMLLDSSSNIFFMIF